MYDQEMNYLFAVQLLEDEERYGPHQPAWLGDVRNNIARVIG